MPSMKGMNIMKIDITWTITAVIAASSILSSILVAIINNKYQSKIRKMELEHAEHMHQLDLQQQIISRQFDIYYSNKREAFSEFMNAAGNFSAGKNSSTSYRELHSAIDKALLFCDQENQALLCNFQNYIDTKAFGEKYSLEERSTYSKTLNKISLSLNHELESSKPVIQSESREH